MKKLLLAVICVLAMAGSAVHANIIGFTAIDGSGVTGFVLPLADSGFSLVFGGQATMTDEFNFNGYVGIDGIPVLGGLEVDANVANNELSSIAVGKGFYYDLTKEVSIGLLLYFVDYQVKDPNTITFLPLYVPLISAELKF